MVGMRRREVIALIGGAAASIARPPALRAQQQTKIPRIGIIDDSPRWNAFRQGLRDLGYLEGQNSALRASLEDGQARVRLWFHSLEEGFDYLLRPTRARPPTEDRGRK